MAIISISGRKGSGKDLVGKIIQLLTSQDYEAVVGHYGGDVEKALHQNSLVGLDAMSQSEWKIKKFADPLKDMVCILLGCTRKQLEDREFKNTPLKSAWTKYYFVYGEHLALETTRHPTYDDAFSELQEIANDDYNKDVMDLNFYLKEVHLTPREVLQLLGTDCVRDIIHPNAWVSSTLLKYHGDTEIWKDIEGYEGSYQISSFGNVRSLDRTITYGQGVGQYHNRRGQDLKISSYQDKYSTVGLSGTTHTVHSLVAKGFCSGFEQGKVVNHKDFNGKNNFYKNLEWVTQAENVTYSIKYGVGNVGTSQKDSKLDDKKVLEIKAMLKTKIFSQAFIAKQFEVSPTTITDIKKGRKWKHVGIKKPAPILPILPPDWIITDMRFPNELEAVKERDGITIRVNRSSHVVVMGGDAKDYTVAHNPVKRLHPSETALDNAEFDYTINNDGTIGDLIVEVERILRSEKIIK